MKWRNGFFAGAVMLAAAATPPAAGEPRPFADFTFRRVTPPKPGATRRITVQIVPQAAVHLETTDIATPGGGDSFAWYWAVVSPDLSATAPGRLPDAIRQLAKGPGVPAPDLQDLTDIADRYGADILRATIGTRVSPALVLAVIGTESSGRPGAVSDAGATGLMQLMPDTAARFGVADISDPGENIRGGVAYLDWLMKEFNADPILVLAGYNAGENAVTGHAGVPPFAETRAYVPKVLAAWAVARGLCATPPELITDGCAFAVQGRVGDG